ncbi:MAG: carboxylate--amine ligase [bacterium]
MARISAQSGVRNGRLHPHAVVLGVADTGYGVIRSLAAGGVPVIGFEKDLSVPEAHTRLCEEVIAYKDDEHLLQLLTRVSQRLGERPVLFVTSDPLVLFCSRHRETLSRHFRFHLPDTETLLRLMEKQKFQALAEQLKCLIPVTIHIHGRQGIEAAVAAVPPPYVIKPFTKSASWKAAGLDKAIIIEDRDPCRQVLDRVIGVEDNLILQELVPGGDDSIYFCLVYFDGKSECRGFFCGRKLRQWPPLTGDTASAVPCEDEEIAAATIRFFRQVNYQGFGSMEFKQHALSKKYYMIEPTVGRPDHQSYIATANGVNLPLEAYHALTEGMTGVGPAPSSVRPKSPVMWIDEPHDLAAVCHSLLKGTTRPAEILRPLCGRKSFRYWNAGDPRPFLFLVGWALRKLAARVAARARSSPGQPDGGVRPVT